MMDRSEDFQGSKVHKFDKPYANNNSNKVTKLIANDVLINNQENTNEHKSFDDWPQQDQIINYTSHEMENDDNKNVAQSSRNNLDVILDDPYRLRNKRTPKTSTRKRDTKSQCSPISLFESMNFEIVNGATQRGRPMLIDNQNFTYNIKKVKMNEIIWRCSVRNRYVECTSIIIQDKSQVYENYAQESLGTMPAFVSSAINNFSVVDHYIATYPWLFNVDPTDTWFKGPLSHIHPQPKKSSLEKIKFTAQVKNMVHKDVSQSSNLILSRIAVPPNIPYQAPTVYEMMPSNDFTLDPNNFEGSNIEYTADINLDTSSKTNIHNVNYNQTPLPPEFVYTGEAHPESNALLQSTILSNLAQNNSNSQQSIESNYRKDLLRAINRTRNTILSRNTINPAALTLHDNASPLNNETMVSFTDKQINPAMTNSTIATQSFMASFKDSPFFDESESPGYYA